MVNTAKEILEKFYEKYHCEDLNHVIKTELEEGENEFKYVVSWEEGAGTLFLCATERIPDHPVSWRFQIVDTTSNTVAAYSPLVYDGSVGDFLPIKNYFFRAKLVWNTMS